MKFKPHALPHNSLPQIPFQVIFAPDGKAYVAYMVMRPDEGHRSNLKQIIIEELQVEPEPRVTLVPDALVYP